MLTATMACDKSATLDCVLPDLNPPSGAYQAKAKPPVAVLYTTPPPLLALRPGIHKHQLLLQLEQLPTLPLNLKHAVLLI